MSGLVAGPAGAGAEEGVAVFGAEWLQARVASRAAAIGVVRGTRVSGMGRGGGNLAGSYDMGNGRFRRTSSAGAGCSTAQPVCSTAQRGRSSAPPGRSNARV